MVVRVPQTALLACSVLAHVVASRDAVGHVVWSVISSRFLPSTSPACGWVGWLSGRCWFVTACLGHCLTLVRSRTMNEPLSHRKCILAWFSMTQPRCLLRFGVVDSSRKVVVPDD